MRDVEQDKKDNEVLNIEGLGLGADEGGDGPDAADMSPGNRGSKDKTPSPKKHGVKMDGEDDGDGDRMEVDGHGDGSPNGGRSR